MILFVCSNRKPSARGPAPLPMVKAGDLAHVPDSTRSRQTQIHLARIMLIMLAVMAPKIVMSSNQNKNYTREAARRRESHNRIRRGKKRPPGTMNRYYNLTKLKVSSMLTRSWRYVVEARSHTSHIPFQRPRDALIHLRHGAVFTKKSIAIIMYIA